MGRMTGVRNTSKVAFLGGLSLSLAIAAVAADLEGAAGNDWADAKRQQTRLVLEQTSAYKDMLADAVELFAQPTFSQYTPFPIVYLYGETIYGFNRRGFFSTS